MNGLAPITLPAIFKLNDDVLLEIFAVVFYMNVLWLEEEEWLDRCKIVYRDSFSISGVCSSWRQLALEAPFLWTVINLRMFEKAPEQWRTEVLRRTKQSPLIIAGRLSRTSKPEIISFFKSVVRDEFSRIEKVVVSISVDARNRDLDPTHVDVHELGALFCRPAPMMTSFSFTIDTIDDYDELQSPSIPIFVNGEAPALTCFESKHFCLGLEDFHSLSHLSCLTMIFPPTTLQVIDLLEHIPSLTRLSLECSRPPSTISPSQELPYITPPNLNSIAIKFSNTAFFPFIDLLDHIQPMPGTSLELSCALCANGDLEFTTGLSPQRLETFQRVLQKFLFGGSDAYICGSAAFCLDSTDFAVETSCSHLHSGEQVDAAWPTHSAFEFSIEPPPFGVSWLDDDDMRELVRIFSTCDLSMVKVAFLRGSFQQESSRRDYFDPYWSDHLWDSDPRIRFLKKLVSLERLKASPTVLSQFSADDVKLQTVFPNLKVVELRDRAPSQAERAGLLLAMKKWSLPTTSMIRRLHIDAYIVSFQHPNLSFLDKAIGLRITWGTRGRNRDGDDGDDGYTCGTGNPERLDFSQIVQTSGSV